MLEKVEKPLSPKGQENFAKVRESLKQREAEIAERDAKIKAFEERESQLKSEQEATQNRIKELESKLSTANPEDFTAKEQKYQQELESLRGELKLISLERDPEFVSRFDKPKEMLHASLQELAQHVQVSPEDFQRAVRFGNEEKLDEIREALTPHLQRKWDAALTQIEQINLQREIALKNKEETYREISTKRQQEHAQLLNQRHQQTLALAEQLAREPFEKFDAFREDQQLQSEVRSKLIALAGGQGAETMTPEQIMREFAASVVQRKVLQTQHQIIESTKAENEELKAKLKEREDFIQKQYGALPSNEVKGSEQKGPEKPRPIWDVARDAVHGKGDFI